jgi:hypothetical protein
MTLLNSKFDITSVDNPVATAALAQVLPVNNPPALGINGTPQPGSIPPGAIVVMNTSGKAVLATTPDISMAARVLPFIALEGDQDYSGSFVQKLAVVHGGLTCKTDQYNAGSYVPGAPLTFSGGKFSPLTAAATQQLIGFVGPAGLDAVNGILEVILPQGAGL